MNTLALHHWPLAKLVEYSHNPRKNDDVVDRMCAAIQEFGFRIPIVAQSDGVVVDGHLRLKAARKLNLETVPVVLADELTPAQIKAFRLLANQSSSWADWDEELLKLELQSLQELDFDLEFTGFDAEEIERLLENENAAYEGFIEDGNAAYKGLKDEDTLPKLKEESAVTILGDLWSLGKHRLLCGDSCDAEAIAKLMQNSQAAITVCDPPYNLNYTPLARDPRSQKLYRKTNCKILNDHLGKDFPAFLEAACSNILSVTKGAVYICMSSSELHTLYNAFTKAGGQWSDFIIWAKNRFSFGRSDYQSQYEAIFYGWKTSRYWCGSRTQSNVWFFDKPLANDLHPTMKPVALMERAIRNSSKPGEIVFDPFGGSGTTLIACEKLNRHCCMVELSPQYCDVIIKRWQEFTGKSARLDATGDTFAKVKKLRLKQGA